MQCTCIDRVGKTTLLITSKLENPRHALGRLAVASKTLYQQIHRSSGCQRVNSSALVLQASKFG